jgi:predicted permease
MRRALRAFVNRLRSLVGRSQRSDQLRDEIDLHIELRRDALIAAGMDPREAHYEARRLFGNATVKREEARDVWTFPKLETIGQDVRYALRLLRRSPMFATIAVLALGIGIGAATAVFTLVDAVLLRKLAVHNPDELVVLRWHSPATARMPAPSLSGNFTTNESGQSSTSFSLPTVRALREGAPADVRVIGFAGYMAFNVASEGTSESADAQAVSGNYFDTLGVVPALGRLIGEADDRAGAEPVAVISHAFWQQRFAGRTDIVGRVLAVNATPVTVVGVLPSSFRSTLQVGESPLITVPLSLREALERSPDYQQARNWWVLAMARLPRGTAEPAVHAALDARFRQSVAEGNAALKDSDLPRLQFLPGARGQSEVRDGTREPLRIMTAIVGVVLLVSCAIVANLLLARGRARLREMTVRVAIGAPRARVIRQLLTEGLLLAALGSACGLVVAKWIADGLAPVLSGSWGAANLDLAIDARAIGFTAAVATVCTILSALLPALRASDVHLSSGLQEQPRTMTTGRRRGLLSNGLVTIQVALSMLLLTAAALLVRSVWNLRDVQAGFDPSNILIFRLDPMRNGYTPERARALYEQAEEQLMAMPGVRSVTFLNLPLIGAGGARGLAALPDAPVLEMGSPAAREFFQTHETHMLTVGDNFFTTLGIPIRRGRGLTASDTDESQPVAVVNEALARQLFGSEDAIGRSFKTDFRATSTLYEVVGICADAKYTSLRRPAPPTAYFTFRQRRVNTPTFAVKTASNPLSVAATTRETFRRLDPNLPLFAMRTQEDQIASSMRRERLMARLAAMLGIVTLLLAAIGVFGVLAGEVTRRTPEIGLRMALGAGRTQVRWMVMRQSLLIVGVGLLVGLPAAIGGARVLSSLLFGLTPSDPTSLGSAAALMAAIGLGAAYLPARRASRVDPIVALRSE